ncbi:proton-translocating NADH-quinone oxidoreductase subunit L [Salinisphaera sp. PC39]|uniref:NADH-quinone oxidoreductase subunit L n=1 Tax=Salinisphaera sp. PC39 TaxID=1304156 RepID=UPI003340E1A3
MTVWLWTIPALPLAGAVALFLLRLPRAAAMGLGVASVGVAAVMSLVVGADFLGGGETVFSQRLWTWLDIAGFTPGIAFHLDGLAVVMLGVITGVGFLIHLYASEYMAEDTDARRFFAIMNLFVAAMLVLVLADNLLLLYLGWEGVGLCSYLLIGFWYRDPANGAAARKAFIVTRIGDAAMALGLLLLFAHLGTLHIPELLARADTLWQPGHPAAVIAAFLLLGGAVGKSAQLPLQTWLPDAMAGPTPVSALIHAATMVTAGVYLIARLHPLYELAPPAQAAVAVVGAATLLIAGVAALGQTDMKRILAYSTVSQIGYMFLALGVGAWSAGLLHLMTHAFFKALLFLAAGAVMLRLHHETDIFRMGGLRRELPAAFWSMLIGGAALAGVPWITAGYWSKEAIILAAWENGAPGIDGAWLYAAGVAGAALTGLYTFRLVFVAFFGPGRRHAEAGTEHSLRVLLPLSILMALSLIGALIPQPLAAVLPEGHHGTHPAWTLWVASLAGVAGIALAWLLYGRGAAGRASNSAAVRFARGGLGFDWLYDRLLVRPLTGLAHANRNDILDRVFDGIAWLNREFHAGLAATQTGRLRWYAAGVAGGAALLLLAAGGGS